MTNHQMQYFIVAAQTLNFTTAAERLYMTQPALSRQIAALENELGVELFRRSHNVVELTDVGKYFYDRILSIHEELGKLIQEIHDLDQGIEGRLRIGLLEDQTLSPKLTAAIQRILTQYPHISFDIRRYNYCSLIDRLNDRSIDIFQASLYDGLSDGPYSLLPLSQEPMYLAYNPNFLTFDQDSVKDNEELNVLLGDYPIVLAETASYPAMIRKSLPPIPLRGARFVSELSSIPLFISIGAAATITNGSSLIAADRNVALLPLHITSVMQGVVWLSERQNPILDKLLDQLRELS